MSEVLFLSLRISLRGPRIFFPVVIEWLEALILSPQGHLTHRQFPVIIETHVVLILLKIKCFQCFYHLHVLVLFSILIMTENERRTFYADD